MSLPLFSLEKWSRYDENIETENYGTSDTERYSGSAPWGLLITDKESRVLYVSAALERRTGFSLRRLLGKNQENCGAGR